MRFREYLIEQEVQEGIAGQAYNMARSQPVQSFIQGQATQAMQPNTSNATQQTALDALQTTLDLAGLEPSVGTIGDAVNAIISAGRAVTDPQRRGEHLANSVISLVSMIPMADVAKLLKAKQGASTAKGFVKFGQTLGRPIQAAARQLKQQRMMQPFQTLGQPNAN